MSGRLILAFAAAALVSPALQAGSLMLFPGSPFTGMAIRDPATVGDALDDSQTAPPYWGVGGASFVAHAAFDGIGFDLSAWAQAASSAGGSVSVYSMDTLSFTGISEGWLWIDFQAEGGVSGGGGEGMSGAALTYTLTYSAGEYGFTGTGGLGPLAGPLTMYAPGGGSATGGIEGGRLFLRGTAKIPITFATAILSSQLAGQVECLASLSGGCNYALDFLHTAQVGGARITDPSGAPVAGASFTSQSGYDYTTSLDPVPEPATAGALLTTLTVLLLRRPRG